MKHLIYEDTSTYSYLGDFAATPLGHGRYMVCHHCKVSWTGCWDNFECPECGRGELPYYMFLPTTNTTDG